MSQYARRNLLTGALGLASAVALGACTRIPKQPTATPSATTAQAQPPASPAPLPTPPTSYAMDPRRPQPKPGHVLLGAYLKLAGMDQDEALALRHKQLGRDLPILHWFYELNDAFPVAYPKTPKGTTLMYSWFGGKLSDVLSGKRDSLLRTNAKRMAAYKKPIYLRWSWEMNGTWYDHSGYRNGKDPAKFVEAWRHVHDVFRRNGADNVGFVWSPFWASTPIEPWNTWQNYYPGDEYVDWVGVSGYFTRAELTPEAIFDSVYRLYADRKPIMITETGIAAIDPRLMAERFGTFVKYLDERPGIAGLVWFDTNTHVDTKGEVHDLRIDINPELLAAYKEMADEPRFG